MRGSCIPLDTNLSLQSAPAYLLLHAIFLYLLFSDTKFLEVSSPEQTYIFVYTPKTTGKYQL
jgi:hypothetical protein